MLQGERPKLAQAFDATGGPFTTQIITGCGGLDVVTIPDPDAAPTVQQGTLAVLDAAAAAMYSRPIVNAETGALAPLPIVGFADKVNVTAAAGMSCQGWLLQYLGG
jgi:hypothetical protein